jgi:hypothetical protein
VPSIRGRLQRGYLFPKTKYADLGENVLFAQTARTRRQATDRRGGIQTARDRPCALGSRAHHLQDSLERRKRYVSVTQATPT